MQNNVLFKLRPSQLASVTDQWSKIVFDVYIAVLGVALNLLRLAQRLSRNIKFNTYIYNYEYCNSSSNQVVAIYFVRLQVWADQTEVA